MGKSCMDGVLEPQTCHLAGMLMIYLAHGGSREGVDSIISFVTTTGVESLGERWMVRPREGGITSRAHMKGSYDTIEFQIIEPRVVSSKLPPLLRTGVIFCPSERLNNSSSAVFFAPFQRGEFRAPCAWLSDSSIPGYAVRLGESSSTPARWGPGKRRRDKAK